MRPYQITATERILNRIVISTNYKKYGTIDAGGFIWHTTGSGKTLTSFKTATLARNLEDVDKVLFVVDRKDLDYQTMKEYDRFQKDCANSNSSTAILTSQLENNEDKIIITTIQKLATFIKKNKSHPVFNKHVVMIFDECHRSQFGEMHTSITKNFKKYHIFGFTGTPIKAENTNLSTSATVLKTTEQTFGDELHHYTIVDAIKDGNVLPFRIDYISTIKEKDDTKDKQVRSIDYEKAMLDDKRIEEVVKYIREHFNQKTKRDKEFYSFKQLQNIKEVATAKIKEGKSDVEEKKVVTHIRGFNSIFAVSSIEAAKKYYLEFKKQQENIPKSQSLNVGIIYSYGANEEENDNLDDENNENTDGLDKGSRDFLDMAIKDYNKIFDTSYDTSSEKFQNYYKDISLRMKNMQLDLLIVVNMFLTGFDATTLNTLWVDKNLKYHGLIQAYSRTNRILNSVKTFGNIVCFRNLEERTDEAIAMFGNTEAGGIVLLKRFEDYYNGYDEKGKHHSGYCEVVDSLNNDFPLGEEIIGESKQEDFIKLYGKFLRLRNILSCFDQFESQEKIEPRQIQDYQSIYLKLYEEHTKRQKNKENTKEDINDDIVFEIELIKQVEINIDYILELVKQQQQKGDVQDKEFGIGIDKAIDSTLNLRSKKDLIKSFILSINPQCDVDDHWRKFINSKMEEELNSIITEEKLKPIETKDFVTYSFRYKNLKTNGTDIDSILPPMSRFSSVGGNRLEKKNRVIEKLTSYYERYVDFALSEI